MSVPNGAFLMPPPPEQIRIPVGKKTTPAALKNPPASYFTPLVNSYSNHHASPGKGRLVTIGYSHYCEKGRWGLDLSPAEYEEEPHAPGMHMFYSLPVSGQSLTPLIEYSKGDVVCGSRQMLEDLCRRYPKEMGWLYPKEILAEVKAVEEFADDVVAPLVRQWAYSFFVHDRNAQQNAKAWMTADSALVEKAMFPLMMPYVVKSLRKMFVCNYDNVGIMEDRFGVVVERLERLLADGRTYIVGGRFTAADISLCSLLYPIAMPKEIVGVFVPGGREISPEWGEKCEKFRDSPLARYVAKIYHLHRFSIKPDPDRPEDCKRKITPVITARNNWPAMLLTIAILFCFGALALRFLF